MAAPRKILVCEDEDAIREFEVINLQRSGYEVVDVSCGEDAIRVFDEEGDSFSVAILDIMMPGIDGFAVCKHIREKNNTLGIIMLSAKSQEMDKVNGLMLGADDYITKPFGIMEFLSRVRAALRRSAPEEKTNVYAFHEILLDNARHSVTVNGAHVDLTYKEYSLLRLLLENTNLVVTRETILQVVWGTDISVESRTVDMHIRTLRKKLGDAGKYICTVRKVGYKLADSEEETEE